MIRKHFSKIASYAIGLPVVFSFGLVREVSAFKERDLLAVQIKAMTIKGESIDQVLSRLTSDYDMPIGIELGDEKLTPRREIELNLPETNLKEFLDSVVAKDPRYTWKLEGDVIHIWPVTARDTLITTLLDTKISHFSIIGDVNRTGVFYDVMNLPEISSKLVINGVAPLTFVGPGSNAKLNKNTFLDESSLTLRVLLDRIVLKTEIKGWVILRWGKNSEYITLRSG